MNPLRLAAFSLTAASLLALGSACSSDSNPFDATTTTTQTPNAKILLKLNVAATRADLSTTAEKKVTNVSIYVFNEDGLLEDFKAVSVSGETSEAMEITSGPKTVYAVAGKTFSNSSVNITENMSMTTFEDMIFDSKETDLTSSNNYTMIGKSTQQMIYAGAQNYVPIQLERLVAKTQLKLGAVSTTEFGFTYGNANFYVGQTCNRMRLKPNGEDVMDFTSHTNGTYAGYTRLPFDMPLFGVTGDFKADQCAYISENIIKNPVAGNTTFMILEIPMTPQYNYTYNQSSNSLTSASNTGFISTFYAVGIVNREKGYEDFVMDVKNNRVVTFTNDTEARNYAAALNGGTAPAVTVSEFESPMKVSSAKAPEFRNFEVVTFSNKMAYYRINIKDDEGNCMVKRNTFYKITVNSIKSLGCHSMELLYPEDPEADSTVSTASMLGVKFNVAEWDEVGQDVDLD